MADSGAVRAQRYRKHAAGDHSMCRHPAEARIAPAVRLAAAPEPGELDTWAELTALARRLAAAHEAAPDRADVARELRATLLAVAAAEPAAADPMDVLREMAGRVS